MNILLTRPEPGATETAARLAALGHQPISFPCLTITPRRPKLPEAPSCIIVTSGQAVPALPLAYRQVPIFCVGDATAGRLREAGFANVSSAGGTATELYDLIVSRRTPGLYLLAVGERQGLALARRLRAAGMTVLRRAVYAASPVRCLPAGIRAALAGRRIAAALFYSAETARAFVRLNPPETAAVTALALSPQVATALGGLPWRAIHVAVVATEADLLALLA